MDDYYSRFLKVVETSRAKKINADEVRKLADGRVYTGTQAMANGLADSIGYMNDAIMQAKQAAKSQKVKVVIYHKPFGYKANAYSSQNAVNPVTQVNMVNVSVPDLMNLTTPQCLYLWTGK